MDKDQILAKWIAGELSDTELKNMVSAEEYIDYLKLRKGISLYEMTQKPLSNNTFKNIEKATKRTKFIKIYQTIAGVAAVLLILLSLNHFFSPTIIETTTAYGEQQEITLPDGSTIQLDAQSTLTYQKDNWDKNRAVQLTGNAYFDIQKGSTFTVKTQNGQVTVLGTKFTVNSFDDYFNVKCFEGKVKVITDSESVLMPLETIQKIGHNTQKLTINYHQPLWLKGESRFKSTPLKYVLTAIENQYGIHFIKQNIDENMLFTGSFNHHNLDLTLKVVLKASNIKIKKKNAHTYVLTK